MECRNRERVKMGWRHCDKRRVTRRTYGIGAEPQKRGGGGRKRQATALWDWETRHHREVNHEPTMGSPAKGSRKTFFDYRTAVKCPQE